MKVTVDTAYGNFAISATIDVDGITEPLTGSGLKLVKLGLASELYRLGNSAVDKMFAPLEEKIVKGERKMVPVLKGFERNSVMFAEGNAAVVKDVLEEALGKAEYEGVSVKVSEKVKGDEAAPMKRATELLAKVRGQGKLDALVMMMDYEGDVEDEGSLLKAVHAYLTPKGK